ncbi:MAG: hypothetical protein IMF01_10775, partial [Proteobacteria bacterium]|nr:hypothetical protein [Pseudomonadota bacterium]
MNRRIKWALSAAICVLFIATTFSVALSKAGDVNENQDWSQEGVNEVPIVATGDGGSNSVIISGYKWVFPYVQYGGSLPEIGYTEIKQTFLEGQAPPGGYVKLRGPDVNTDVPDDCVLTIYDATFSNYGDVVARCDLSGRNEVGTAVFRNQVLFIGPKETLVLSFPGEGRFLMEGGYVEVGCLEGGPVWASV